MQSFYLSSFKNDIIEGIKKYYWTGQHQTEQHGMSNEPIYYRQVADLKIIENNQHTRVRVLNNHKSII